MSLAKLTAMDFIVVGIGFFGKKWAELLQKQPLVSLAATVDVNEAAAQWSRETLGIPVSPVCVKHWRRYRLTRSWW
jgi:hypothetical protein